MAATYIQTYFEFLEHQGHNLDSIQRTSGVDIHDITERSRAVSVDEMRRLVSSIYSDDNQSSGLEIGARMPLSIHGMAGVSIMAQETYGDCLKMAPYFCSIASPALQMEYFEEAQIAGIRITEKVSLAPYSKCLFEAIAVNFYNILHFLLGNNAEPEYIGFPYEEPSYIEKFDQYFKCPIKFNTQCTEFVVSKEIAARKLLLANRNIALSAKQNFLKNTTTDSNIDLLTDRLRDLLSRNVGNFPSLDEAAHSLGMSGRTLRRKLNELNTNFQHELDEVRKELAIDFLNEDKNCITDIALLLGFCDSSAFSKSFKKWSGQSPREFKKNLS